MTDGYERARKMAESAAEQAVYQSSTILDLMIQEERAENCSMMLAECFGHMAAARVEVLQTAHDLPNVRDILIALERCYEVLVSTHYHNIKTSYVEDAAEMEHST